MLSSNHQESMRRPAAAIAAEANLPLLIATIQSVLENTTHSAEQRIKHTKVLLTSLAGAPPPAPEPPREPRKYVPLRGALAAWQVKKVKTFIHERVSSPITCADMAQTVRLSPQHFCRCFRVTLQETPHAYVMRTRVERACVLIRSTQATFGDIAAECGFSDQAHFNRVFRKLLGLTPSTWRRLQALPATPE